MHHPMIDEAAARATVRLHENATAYLRLRSDAVRHLTGLQERNDSMRSATVALQRDEVELGKHLGTTDQMGYWMHQISSVHPNPIEAHLSALQCETADQTRVLELRASVLAEESLLDLFVQKYGDESFDSIDELVKLSMGSGRRMFLSKFLQHRLQRQLAIPLESSAAALPSSSSAPHPRPAAAFTATASNPPQRPPPAVPKRLPPKAALKASFPQASDAMIDKVLLSTKNDMAAARKKLKELCSHA